MRLALSALIALVALQAVYCHQSHPLIAKGYAPILASNGTNNGTSPVPSPSPGPIPTDDPCAKNDRCGSCLKENGCQWCLIPEGECRSTSNVTHECTVYRTERDGCYGLVNVYLTKTQKMIAYIVLGVVGLLTLAIGYKLVKPVLFLAGFTIGFFVGTTAVYYITSEDPTGWRVWGTGIAVGIVLGAAATLLLQVGIFFMGGLAGAIIGYHVFGVVEREVDVAHGARWSYVAMAGGAIVVGCMALLAQKIILIVGTSVAGAFAVCSSVLYFTPYNDHVTSALSGGSGTHDDKPAALFVYLSALGILTIAGICFQFYVTRGHEYRKGKYVRKEEGEHAEPLLNRNIYGYDP